MLFVREDRQAPVPGQRFRAAVGELVTAARTPAVLVAAAFLFLWSFNPFNTSVLYLYMMEHLKMSEQEYGISVALLSVGAIAGSLGYGLYCRRVSLVWLVHLAIAAGVVSTLAYCLVQGPTSSRLVSLAVGFTYMTGSMVLLDLAARACPIHAAGTTFALLMSLSNLSLSLSVALGSWLYGEWSLDWGATPAFRLLVLIGSLSTCLCWLLFPFIKKILTSTRAV